MDKNIENFVNAALKLAEEDDLTQLEADPKWEELDHDTLVLMMRIQSAVLRNRTVELDGWTEAIRLVREIAVSKTEDVSAYNEVCALLHPRLGSGEELTLLMMIIMALDGWRERFQGGEIV